MLLVQPGHQRTSSMRRVRSWARASSASACCWAAACCCASCSLVGELDAARIRSSSCRLMVTAAISPEASRLWARLFSLALWLCREASLVGELELLLLLGLGVANRASSTSDVLPTAWYLRLCVWLSHQAASKCGHSARCAPGGRQALRPDGVGGALLHRSCAAVQGTARLVALTRLLTRSAGSAFHRLHPLDLHCCS